MVCLSWASRENAIILAASGNLSCFRKKNRFVEVCSWFTLIGTGCRTCWLPRNLFDNTLLHSQSSRSFSGYLKPNYSNETCPRTHCRYIGYFGSPRAMVYAPQKIKALRREKAPFSLGITVFSIFFMFFNITFISWDICFINIMLERSCTIIPDTQSIKTRYWQYQATQKGANEIR